MRLQRRKFTGLRWGKRVVRGYFSQFRGVGDNYHVFGSAPARTAGSGSATSATSATPATPATSI